MKTHYDIFISYRRTAYDTANLIAEKLRHAGYRVFFDVDTLTAGKFNEQLLEVIGNCQDFVLVLPENALDRCVDNEDWIRREVTCAMEHHKNIIPVMLDGFECPAEMPKGLEELPGYQAIAAVNREYFDMAVERLKGYLKSKPKLPIRNWAKKAGIILAVLLVFLCIGIGVAKHIANVTCEDIATQQTAVMSAVDGLGDIRQDIKDGCKNFFSSMSKCKDDESCRRKEKDMLTFLTKAEKDVNNYRKVVPAPDFKVNDVENYVLAFYGVKKEELKAFSDYYLTLYNDMDDLIGFLREIIDAQAYSDLNEEIVNTHFVVMDCSSNAFYYGYLASLSLLPKSARNSHYEISKKWLHFPNGTPLDLSQEDYEQFQQNEMNKIQEVVYQKKARIKYEDETLNNLEEQVDQLKQKE